MTLRTTALIAGALGLLLFIGGLIADAVRPSDVGEPRATLDTSVVVLEPDILALSPEAQLTVEGSGEIAAYVGRTSDAEAWIATRDVTFVTGVPVWEELAVEARDAQPVESSASPSPSASASASASAEPSAGASPSASPSASPAPSEAPVADIWRQHWTATGTLEMPVAQVPVGNTLVIESVDGTPLEAVQLTIPRAIDDAWVAPLKWWGAILAVIGIIALGSLIFDIRAARGRGESWAAARRQASPARPGGRRHRREELAATGGIPVVAEGDVAEPAVHADGEDDADRGSEAREPEAAAPDGDDDEDGEVTR
ncbi:hypothetical protein [Demequina lignilytica]|uniref:Transmembrane protein n=1 Tax=Demequina lignilytica TaxID=3051663 RepID=A0AB35MFM4_9MICO|nr:hypothetical protein [Demequina sp. SYSU T0a273]MDN4482545.1 hypothetical protein [Demequina sp. SYSU T0a273]